MFSSIFCSFFTLQLVIGAELWPWEVIDESLLINTLFRGHDAQTRPIWNQSETLVIKLGLHLHQIRIHPSASLAEAQVLLVLEWIDEELAWDPDHWDGIQSLSLPAHRLWRPDLTCVNVIDIESHSTPLMRLHATGLLHWKQTHKILTPVKRKGSSFELSFEFQSAQYDARELEIQHLKRQSKRHLNQKINNGVNTGSSASVQYWTTHDAWAVESSVIREPDGPCCEEEVASLTFFLTVQKRGSELTKFLSKLLVMLLPLFVFLLRKSYKLQYLVFNLSLLLVLMDHLPLNSVLVILIFNLTILLVTLSVMHLLLPNPFGLSPFPGGCQSKLQRLAEVLGVYWPRDQSVEFLMETSLDHIDRDQTLNALALHFQARTQQLLRTEERKATGAILDRISFIIFTISSTVILSKMFHD